ncbi:uncharacterized protein N7511_009999 [Penicillium nucicola]|uniref:uncharacterized protein n=1 Tax=Penicillium nucicola TaxID=1850975 RepID=UPI0025451CB8|nr:uncharacterized protein N7511_009999 [Penicillium nucicola]KAJ5748303.1 hypothetical protein N7511_009999 [Penicillium nucicola]
MSKLQVLFNSAIQPLPAIEDQSFASDFDSFAGKQVMLLGDGSHETSEFYSARAEITKRLIERHGYTMVAVEADWPDAEAINRYVRLRPGPKSQLGGIAKGYERPSTDFQHGCGVTLEMQQLVEWMRDRNQRLPPERRAGFYELDLYSMGASIGAVIDYLDRVDTQASKQARRRYECLEPWIDDPTRGLRDGDEYHSGEQNAYLIRDAEKNYKAMYYSSASSWNLRAIHMFETLERLLQHHEGQKAIVMGFRRKELNIGQLCRERLGRENVTILGCGTHTGTVAAAHEWDDDSWEIIAHDTEVPSFVLDLRQNRIDTSLRAALAAEQRLQRFIGVIYRPDTERISHYSQVFLHKQFDGYIWFDETQAVSSLEVVQPDTPLGKGETYPFGL